MTIEQALNKLNGEVSLELYDFISAKLLEQEAELAELREQRTYDLAGAGHMQGELDKKEAALKAADDLCEDIDVFECFVPMTVHRSVTKYRAAREGK